jgi:hypothetical protein
MAGWSHQKREAFEEAFYAFLAKCRINSKNLGFVSLGDNLYYGQKRFITAVLDGLEEDKHDIYVLKSRQLGITTIARALSTFYLGIHRGLSGALVFDSNENKNLARDELVTMISDLPDTLKFPPIKKDNRDGLTLNNNSKILFKSAGVKKTKTSGTLGRSAGLTLSHGSELCSWDNDEGLVSYRRSLSDSHPDRLYIWESTARGPNAWQDMWYEARADVNHCICVFIGWWAHDGQRIEQDSKDWEFYGVQPPTTDEQKKIDRVKELYDFDISQEQLAWYRRLVDPASRDSGDTDAGFEANQYQKQEDPWDEDEAFQITGSVFFSGESLKDQSDKYVSNKFKSYMFLPGTEFCDLKVYPAETSRNIELKVWEPPQREAVYSFSIDPAFGENENNDRSSFQVLRCYSDGVDQVAEYAYPLISTKHFAWVIAAVMGWYGAEPLTEIFWILELNGPGSAVLDEMKGLKFQIENSYAPLSEQGLRNIFHNVKQYIHARPDSMTGGSAWHWKTSGQNKIMILEKFRSLVGNGQMHIRSQELIREMQRVARDGDTIKATGTGDAGKDDRTLAGALGVHNWDIKIRRNLIVQKRSREAEKVKKLRSVIDQTQLFNQNMMAAFMGNKQQTRMQAQRLAMKNAWRYGRR